MELLGYTAIFFVGVVLAVIGGGGSILTVPIMVYLFGLSADSATSYSLFLVGVAALVGSLSYARKKLIAYRTGVIFAIPAFIGVFLVRKLLMPTIPDELTISSLSLTKDQLILGVFAIIMLMASVSMIRGRKEGPDEAKPKDLNLAIVGVEGLIVGGVTGFVGAGGGFLIIPALVVLAGLPIKTAVGTSLMIIAAKSLIGFTGDVGTLTIDWLFLMTNTAISIGGTLVGAKLAGYVKAGVLKPVFGYFVFVMGTFMALQQIFA